MRKASMLTSTAIAMIMGGTLMAPAAGAATTAQDSADQASVHYRRVCHTVVYYRHHHRHHRTVCRWVPVRRHHNNHWNDYSNNNHHWPNR